MNYNEVLKQDLKAAKKSLEYIKRKTNDRTAIEAQEQVVKSLEEDIENHIN